MTPAGAANLQYITRPARGSLTQGGADFAPPNRLAPISVFVDDATSNLNHKGGCAFSAFHYADQHSAGQDMITPVRSRRPSQPLKWHGGKHYLARHVLDIVPPHTHYVEPYFGGGAVLFAKPSDLIEQHSEVVNDRHEELVTFWRVLQSEDSFAAFKRAVDAMPLAEAEWQRACRCLDENPVIRALAFFVRFRQSRQGLGRDFATMSRTRTRRGMNEQVSSWLSAIDGLEDAHRRLRRVAILCDDAIAIIRREDGPQTFFYCDPPYLHDTRIAKSTYAFEMTTDQHMELLETLGHVAGTFVLSGYPSELYERAARRFGWNRKDILIDNKASSAKTKPKKTESMWYNF
jgi:DNA adenine methylase